MDIKSIVNNWRMHGISVKLLLSMVQIIFHVVQVLMKSILQKVDKKDATLFSGSERKLNIVISQSLSYNHHCLDINFCLFSYVSFLIQFILQSSLFQNRNYVHHVLMESQIRQQLSMSHGQPCPSHVCFFLMYLCSVTVYHNVVSQQHPKMFTQHVINPDLVLSTCASHLH